MRLRSISPRHFGPFSAPAKIKIDEQVTVFTGPNDSGKSYALQAIKLLCQKSACEERHVNIDRIGQFSGPWSEDPDVSISAEFEITEQAIHSRAVRGNLQAGDLVQIRFLLNKRGNGYEIVGIKRGANKVANTGVSIKTLPKVVEYTADEAIGSSIELANMSPAELRVLKIGFGAEFTAATIQSLTTTSRANRVRGAEETLNEKLRSFFPKEMSHEFRLIDIGGEGKKIAVSLADVSRTVSPIDFRGTGVKRLLGLMGVLLNEATSSDQTIILIDEPEISLHADAQHQLRKTLEGMAKNPRIQVVYATHSPSMLNPAHPDRVRVFSRARHDDTATTKVATLTYAENFQHVRVSLGLTPSDSLLYGLVTILVEGDTEARCLGPLLEKLDTEGVSEFKGISELLEFSHFVCGGGDNISNYCKIAADQNAKPIVFLDGDKKQKAEKIRKERPFVPVFELPAGKEFEDLVPRARYIEAVTKHLVTFGEDASKLSLESFDDWTLSSNLPGQMMLSKKVDRWIFHLTSGHSYNKHEVMETAITLTPANEIEKSTLKELAKEIRKQFKLQES